MNMLFVDPNSEAAHPRDLDGQLYLAVANALGVGVPVDVRPGVGPGGLAPWQEKRVGRFIRDNAFRCIHVRDLAAIARLSPSHFSRAFRSSFGMSPYAMISRYRIGQAIRLMVTTNWSLVEIAAACGFADQSHFSRTFHRHIDTSPGRWRRSHSRLELLSS